MPMHEIGVKNTDAELRRFNNIPDRIPVALYSNKYSILEK